MGIRTVAVFSEADRASMHVRMSDEAFSLNGNTPAESYLRQDLILDIANRSHVDAIHPGYGFLSENSDFAQKVEGAGLRFVGPPASAIRALGDKTAARAIANQLKIATVPGTRDAISGDEEAVRIASEIGLPILLKAAAGGGGKGMRVVRGKEDLVSALRGAESEARNAFGDAKVYIEKYLERPRHVEIQVLADGFGNAVFLGERECSIQRRHQKVIEETPSTIVDEAMRTAMGRAAVRLVQSVGYSNAGTVEFLVDEQKQFYFLEVNTRLQVEHPVTELVTGIDLVRQQILIAEGHRLPFSQDDVARRGHALECRICAEDPEDSFFPSTGGLTHYILPQGPRVRVDNGLSQGDSVSIYYDSLMAKVITWGPNRSDAIDGMKRALSEFAIHGVKSTIPFCLSVLNNDRFRRGEFDTGFVEREFRPEKVRVTSKETEIAAAVAAVLMEMGAQMPPTVRKNHQNREQSSWKKLRVESHR
jgi:acetyl-CoA carboxylase, biotin carboxylase subunit